MQQLHDAAELQAGLCCLTNCIGSAVLKNLLKGPTFHIFHNEACEGAVSVADTLFKHRNSIMAGDISLLISAERLQDFSLCAQVIGPCSQLIRFLLKCLRFIVVPSKNFHCIFSSVRSVRNKIDDTCSSASKFAENLILINRSFIQLSVHSLVKSAICGNEQKLQL